MGLEGGVQTFSSGSTDRAGEIGIPDPYLGTRTGEAAEPLLRRVGVAEDSRAELRPLSGVSGVNDPPRLNGCWLALLWTPPLCPNSVGVLDLPLSFAVALGFFPKVAMRQLL